MNHSCYANMMSLSTRLPVDLQSVFDMYYKKGRGNAEICRALDISADELVQRKTRLLRSLRTGANLSAQRPAAVGSAGSSGAVQHGGGGES